MERLDGWLAPSEEAIFNVDARTFNEQFLPLLHTDQYLTAFLHIYQRHNPLLPQWTLRCDASDFVAVITKKWDSYTTLHANANNVAHKRAMVIGIGRRLCSLSLRMDAEAPRDAQYISIAQRRGLLYQIRDVIPLAPTYVVQKYDGTDAGLRLEGAELLSMLSHLFMSLGVEVEHDTGVKDYKYEPYERPASRKLPPPDRRLCSSLAYTAFNVRVCEAGGHNVRPPFSLLGDKKGDQGVTTFSKEDFAQLAHLNDNKYPLQTTLSYLAGKLLELKQLGLDEHYLYNSEYRCQLQRRASAVTLMSPTLLFLQTPFTASEAPRGPSCYQYLSYGCKPILVNGVMDEAAFQFETLLYDEVVSLACHCLGSDFDTTWESIRTRLNSAFLKLLATDTPLRASVDRPSPPSPTDHADASLLEHGSNVPLTDTRPANAEGQVARSPPHPTSSILQSGAGLAGLPTLDTTVEQEPATAESESLNVEVLSLDDVMHVDLLDEMEVASPPPSSAMGEDVGDQMGVDVDSSVPEIASTTPSITLRMSDIEPQSLDHSEAGEAGEAGEAAPGVRMEISSSPDKPKVHVGARPEKGRVLFELTESDADSSDEYVEAPSSGSSGSDSEVGEGKSTQKPVTPTNTGKSTAAQLTTLDTPMAALMKVIDEGGSDLSSDDELPPSTPPRRQTSRKGSQATHSKNAAKRAKKRTRSESNPSTPKTAGKRPRQHSPEDVLDSGQLPFITSLSMESERVSLGAVDLGDIRKGGVERLKRQPKNVHHIGFSAPTADFDGDRGTCTMVDQKFGFTHRDAGVADFFRKLLACYDDAKLLGTGTSMPTMTVEEFAQLAPSDRGVIMKRPIVLVESGAKPSIVNRDRDHITSVTSPNKLGVIPISTHDVTRFLGRDVMLSDTWVDVGVVYCFKNWSEVHPQDAISVRVESCQASTFLFANEWMKHVEEGQSAANAKVQAQKLALALRQRKQVRSNLVSLKIPEASHIIWPYHIKPAHFALAVIQVPSEQDGHYVFYTFDSFQDPMDPQTRRAFALILMELSHCGDEVASAEYELKEVEEFMANCMRFIHVKTTRQTGSTACGLFVIYFVRQLLAHWPPVEQELASSKRRIPWLAASTREVESIRAQLATWIASTMEPSSLSGLPSDLGDSLGSSILRREYAHLYVEQKLGLDPHVVVQVQDLDEPNMEEGVEKDLVDAGVGQAEYERVDMTLGNLAEEVSDPVRSRRLNALSIPSDHPIGVANEIRSLVADDMKAQRSAITGSTVQHSLERSFFADATLETRSFIIISSAGTIHPIHFDGSAFHTHLNVLDGQKLLLLACPVSDTRKTPAKWEGDDPFILMRGDDVIIHLVVLKRGHHLLIPPRTYHAVVTVDSSNIVSNPAVLQGFFFDSRHGMRRMLGGMVECAIWHNCWTNTLYADRFQLLAFMLDWHKQALPSTSRFVGEDLWALLFVAKYNVWLQPIQKVSKKSIQSYDPMTVASHTKVGHVHAFLTQCASRLLKDLPAKEAEQYKALEKEFIAYLSHEYEALYATVKRNEV